MTMATPFFFLVYEAQDVPGLWIGHCLDHDLVVQTSSAREAVDALYKALATVEPKTRQAPMPYWLHLYTALAEGRRCTTMRADPALIWAGIGQDTRMKLWAIDRGALS